MTKKIVRHSRKSQEEHSMNKEIIRAVMSSYGRRTCLPDMLEIVLKQARERIFGFNYSIFDKAIRYYSEVKGKKVSQKEALSRALDKAQHKEAWYKKDRTSLEDKMHFYLEVDIYPFRQAYNKRCGGFRWYRHLVDHFRRPSILEYGCGSAVLTEYLIEKFPTALYTVADIPSVTLDFVKWKKRIYNFPYHILTISLKGIPLSDTYNLIICQDVLEHTHNPLDIVTSFVEHLSPQGVLLVDFIDSPGGENLMEATKQREAVKNFLKSTLIALKAIDEPSGNSGLYIKDNE